MSEPSAPQLTVRAGARTLALGVRPWLMGIVNATPDSFSDGGVHRTLDERVELARELLASGADVIDVGGESGVTNRPAVDPQEEIARVVPLIERIAGELGAVVSVDTYKPPVAAAAIAAGACIVNDVSGLRDPALADVCRDGGGARADAHARGTKAEAARPVVRRAHGGRCRRLPARADGARIRARGRRGAADPRPRPGLRQDAGTDGRGAATARRRPRARPAAAARALAQGLHRRCHRPRPARARGRDARGVGLGTRRRRAHLPPARRGRRGRLHRRARRARRPPRARSRRAPGRDAAPRAGLIRHVHPGTPPLRPATCRRRRPLGFPALSPNTGLEHRRPLTPTRPEPTEVPTGGPCPYLNAPRWRTARSPICTRSPRRSASTVFAVCARRS